jgi:hypothetical protein
MKARLPSPLENLLVEDRGQNNILSRLGVKEFALLSGTCHNMLGFFKTPLPIYQFKLACHLVQEPSDDKVKFILRSNPNLLNFKFKKLELKSQTFFNVTPLQLAYGAKDDVMCNTLKPFFTQLHGSKEVGITEMQKQISEMKDEHKNFDFDPIMRAISNEFFNNGRDAETNRLILSPVTLAAIEQFRNDFDTAQLKIIDKGMHFRWETLDELCDVYTEAARQWNFNYNRCTLLEDAVLAWVLGYVPENGAQYFSQGLYYLQHVQNDKPEPFKRAAITRDGHNFYEVLKNQSIDFFLRGRRVDIIYGRGSVHGITVPNALGQDGCPSLLAARHLVKNFCRAKTTKLKNLFGHLQLLKRPHECNNYEKFNKRPRV